MKAVRFDRYGGIEVLQVADVPMPEPSHGEARCRFKRPSRYSGKDISAARLRCCPKRCSLSRGFKEAWTKGTEALTI
jgi:hypothetical protein